jgi:hypothetical protein
MTGPLGERPPADATLADEVAERVRRSDVPIYTQLSIETGVEVPDPLPADPLRALAVPDEPAGGARGRLG